MKKLLFAASIFLMLFLFNAENTFACSCVAPDPNSSLEDQVKENYEQAPYVFSAKVLSIDITSAGTVNVKVKLLKAWKGKLFKTFTINTASNSVACGYSFNVGTSYLIYAYGYQNQISTNICTRTTPLHLTKDIDVLNKLKKKRT